MQPASGVPSSPRPPRDFLAPDHPRCIHLPGPRCTWSPSAHPVGRFSPGGPPHSRAAQLAAETPSGALSAHSGPRLPRRLLSPRLPGPTLLRRAVPPRPGELPVGSPPTLVLCCRCCCWSHHSPLSELGQTLRGKDSVLVTCTKARGYGGPTTPRLAPSQGFRCWAQKSCLPPVWLGSPARASEKAPPTSCPGEARRKPRPLLPPSRLCPRGCHRFPAAKRRPYAQDLARPVAGWGGAKKEVSAEISLVRWLGPVQGRGQRRAGHWPHAPGAHTPTFQTKIQNRVFGAWLRARNVVWTGEQEMAPLPELSPAGWGQQEVSRQCTECRAGGSGAPQGMVSGPGKRGRGPGVGFVLNAYSRHEGR